MVRGQMERVKHRIDRKLAERLIAHVHAQFGCPSGFWGSIVGWIMASRSSNRRRNAWAGSLLDVQRCDRVMEIGFGPGIAIQEMSRIAVEGHVCGLDHSARMLHQASRRNAEEILAGAVCSQQMAQLLEPADRTVPEEGHIDSENRVVCAVGVNPPEGQE